MRKVLIYNINFVTRFTLFQVSALLRVIRRSHTHVRIARLTGTGIRRGPFAHAAWLHSGVALAATRGSLKVFTFEYPCTGEWKSGRNGFARTCLRASHCSENSMSRTDASILRLGSLQWPAAMPASLKIAVATLMPSDTSCLWFGGPTKCCDVQADKGRVFACCLLPSSIGS